MKFRDGQIIGFPIDDFDHCTKKKYIDELYNAVEKFVEHADAKKAAKECIKSPEFIQVTSLTGLKLFVMEVDIEPSISFCKFVPFYLNIMKLHQDTGRKLKRKSQPPCLFVRDGSSTLQVNEADEKYELESLQKYDQQREFEESCSIPYSFVPEKKAEKLYRKICMGQQALDKSLWPILVLTKPDDMKVKSQTWLDNFKFIRLGNWVCVFDFDDCSYESGIFGRIFPKAKATVTNEEKFKFVENVIQLRDELESPEKVVWIFSNGRKELGKLHKGRKEWNDDYSSGLKGAVQFFHQRCVIPEKRAIVILLLLSNDFAGVVETLYELVSHFSWKQIVIIADERDTFKAFSHIIESERSYYQKELANCSIVGLSWEEVCSVFAEAMGIEDDCDCKIPSTSGAVMTVNPRFLEQLKDIKILSATTCENRKFKKDEKMSFSYEIEKKF
ncbi:hypothetical protein CHS0354_027826 [Potamilus streckersoni]|uniref:Uncharacterized protein n=1 Tax=Potamilus streckersoni TaxID=2493646 RepID=A0AAE0T0P4_9BIVA|nr:hypothetical protein CHS0354_027826 [Potamilus streckersoni]